MIMLLILKAGTLVPIKVPSDKTPDFLFQEIIDAECSGFFSAKDPQNGDEIMIRVSEIVAMRITEETNLKRNLIVPQGGRLQ